LDKAAKEQGALLNYTGYSLDKAAKEQGAVCLDGSPGFYYHRPGTGSGARRWFIHHEGGGWCTSLDDCLDRSRGHYGSSKAYERTVTEAAFEERFTGKFSTDPELNPLMHNWNVIYFKYCDGASFSGRAFQPTKHNGSMLHWRGNAILEAGVSDMLANRGLDQATDVVISGCSAGGLAALLHCDFWSAQVHSKGKTPSRVVCMPDSPFFVDYEGPPRYASSLAWAFVQQNCTFGMSSACVAAEQPASRCMFAEHAAKYVTSPVFMMQSVYDQWQIDNVLGSRSPGLINIFGANLTSRAVGSLAARGRSNGVFLDSCYHHCWAWNKFRIGGYTQAMAFQQWFEKRHATQSAWIQNSTYPCNQCCGG
jgi:hypothetical protein